MVKSRSSSMKFLLLTLLLAHGSVVASGDPMAEIDGGEDLSKVKRGAYEETYVNPDVDFSFYNSVFLTRAIYDYREVKTKLTSGIYSNTTSKREFSINEQDREIFEQLVREAFMEEIVKGKNFLIVDEQSANEKTLIMRGVVVDIISWVPPEPVNQVDLYMSTVGMATIGLEFLDGSTGEILARVAERGRIGNATGISGVGSRPVNRATVIADIKLWARGAARKLRKALDTALATDTAQ